MYIASFVNQLYLCERYKVIKYISYLGSGYHYTHGPPATVQYSWHLHEEQAHSPCLCTVLHLHMTGCMRPTPPNSSSSHPLASEKLYKLDGYSILNRLYEPPLIVLIHLLALLALEM